MVSLIRQVWLMLFGVLLIALLGSVATHTLMARQSLNTHLQVRNDDSAMMLALALSQQRGDTESMRLVASAQFDTGHYQRLRVLLGDGSVLTERERPARPSKAPAWFADLLQVQGEPGVAPVSDGWRDIGNVQVWSQAGWALDQLWAGCVQMAGWLGMLGLAAAALAALAVRTWRRPLQAAVDQAQALEQRRFVIADEPRVPELRHLTRSMNSLVRRLQTVFESQATQLEELRAQAHFDPVTGLLNRRQFVAQLKVALGAERQRGAGLLLVRLRRLEDMNRRIGHEATDRLLAALAQVLQSYPRHVTGAQVGRLNGTDFALYLPAAGLATETAHSLADALRAALATVDPSAELVIGGADLPHATLEGEALALADVALAEAEGRAAFAVEVSNGMQPAVMMLGEQQWQARLESALQSGRASLEAFAVRGPDGKLLHLDCPLRLQLDHDGPFEPAAHWLAMAVRCRLVARLDQLALEMALAAVRADGKPRCVNVAAASLATAGFVAEVRQRLEAAPAEASRLCVDFAEGVALHGARVREACAQWRPLGLRIGLEHASANLRELSRLHALGVDYVKIDAAIVKGAASVPAVRELARGLVGLVRGMGVQIMAEAVEDDADLRALWALGFDGATGSAVAGD